MKGLNKTTLFLLITFITNYGIALGFFLSGYEYTGMPATIMAVVYMFIPMVAAIIVENGVYKNPITQTLNISFKLNYWFLVAWLITPLISFLAIGIALLYPDVSYSPEMTDMFKRFEDLMSPEEMEKMKEQMDQLPVHPVWLALAQGLLAGVTVNAVAGFGEELGWRGFLLKQFKEMHFFKASLIIGIVWGIWHAPLILMGHNYPAHPVIGVFMMTLWCILLTPMFLYITVKAKSVIAAAVLHGTLNGTSGIAIMVIDGGNDLLTGVSGLAGMSALLIITAVLFIFDLTVSKEKIFLKPL